MDSLAHQLRKESVEEIKIRPRSSLEERKLPRYVFHIDTCSISNFINIFLSSHLHIKSNQMECLIRLKPKTLPKNEKGLKPKGLILRVIAGKERLYHNFIHQRVTFLFFHLPTRMILDFSNFQEHQSIQTKNIKEEKY